MVSTESGLGPGDDFLTRRTLDMTWTVHDLLEGFAMALGQLANNVTMPGITQLILLVV
jgi:hypothetical protein